MLGPTVIIPSMSNSNGDPVSQMPNGNGGPATPAGVSQVFNGNGGPATPVSISQMPNKSQSSKTVLVGATLGSILGVVCVALGAFLITRSVRNQKRRRTEENRDVTPFVAPVGQLPLNVGPSNLDSLRFPGPSVEEDTMRLQPSDSISVRRGSAFGNGENQRRIASPSIYHAPTEISAPPSYYTLPPNQSIPRLPVADLSIRPRRFDELRITGQLDSNELPEETNSSSTVDK